MAEVFVHLTACEQLARTPHLYPEIGSAVSRELAAAKLGALLADLPYFDGFQLWKLPTLLRPPKALNRWAQVFHSHKPTSLGVAFAELSQTDFSFANQTWALAFVAGYFSHLAIDRVLNALTQRLVRDNLKVGEDPAELANRYKILQSLFFHGEYYGQNVLGTPLLRSIGRLTRENRPVANLEGMKVFILKGCLKIFASAPNEKELENWIAGFERYAAIVSNPLARLLSSPLKLADPATLHTYFRNDFFNFGDFYNHAMHLACDYINSAYAYMKSGDFTQTSRFEFLEIVPEFDIQFPPDEDALYTVPQDGAGASGTRTNIVPFIDPRKTKKD